MKVQVKLFAVARQATGQDVVEIELREGATVGELRQAITRQVPALADLVPHVTFALDAEYAGDHMPVRPESEIACIPPVSGG